MITPATLFVVPGTRSSEVDAQVPSLLISTNDTKQYPRFGYSSPFLTNTVKGVNDTSKFLVGPRTILSRLSTATATTGRILPISPPFVNSSYSLQLYGPSVQCEEANDMAVGIIDSLLKLKMSTPDGIYSEDTSAYFAFVPNDNILNGSIALDRDTLEEISSVRMQRPAVASNQLWATYTRYVYSSTGMRSTEAHYIACKLYNASYSVGFQFESGNQVIENKGVSNLNEIPYPRDNAYTPTDFAAHSYSSFMWVLTDLLVGSMGWWKENSTNRRFSEITTAIAHNSLLGSVDLDPFFDFNDNLYLQNNATKQNSTRSDQRSEDKDLARSRTLDVLIEELSFNITLSLMSSNLLSLVSRSNPARNTLPNLTSCSSANHRIYS